MGSIIGRVEVLGMRLFMMLMLSKDMLF